MRILGLKTAKTFSRWLQARILGGAIILGYHRIANVSQDGYETCVTPEHFENHMEAISRYAQPISLSNLAQHLKKGTLPSRSVAVTFDDGYADNLYQAKPILEKYEIPATVFICTGYAGKEFWWDELTRLVMSSKADPCALRFQVGESHFQWDQPIVSPDLRSPEDISLRRQFRHVLYRLLLSLDIDDQNNALDTIRGWSGLLFDETFTPRAMDHAELLQLTRGGLVELGAHTRNHLMLPQLSLERQRDEIISCKRDLEEWLGRPVEGFSYPNGRATDYARTVVRDVGFAYACTSLRDMIRPGCDAHKLTRFWQQDVDGKKFMRNLNMWMGMQRN